MGIQFEVIRDGEKYISLTEFSIKNINYLTDTDIALEPKLNNLTRDIVITGIINTESIDEEPVVMADDFGYPILDDNGETQFEPREIDSVRKLANWAIIPEYSDCYCDMKFTLANSRGDLVKEMEFENVFIFDYKESFDDDRGHGQFFAHMREREIRLDEEGGTWLDGYKFNNISKA